MHFWWFKAYKWSQPKVDYKGASWWKYFRTWCVHYNFVCGNLSFGTDGLQEKGIIFNLGFGVLGVELMGPSFLLEASCFIIIIHRGSDTFLCEDFVIQKNWYFIKHDEKFYMVNCGNYWKLIAQQFYASHYKAKKTD